MLSRPALEKRKSGRGGDCKRTCGGASRVNGRETRRLSRGRGTTSRYKRVRESLEGTKSPIFRKRERLGAKETRPKRKRKVLLNTSDLKRRGTDVVPTNLASDRRYHKGNFAFGGEVSNPKSGASGNKRKKGKLTKDLYEVSRYVDKALTLSPQIFRVKVKKKKQGQIKSRGEGKRDGRKEKRGVKGRIWVAGKDRSSRTRRRVHARIRPEPTKSYGRQNMSASTRKKEKESKDVKLTTKKGSADAGKKHRTWRKKKNGRRQQKKKKKNRRRGLQGSSWLPLPSRLPGLDGIRTSRSRDEKNHKKPPFNHENV